MIFPGFPGVLSFFQVFQVEWEPWVYMKLNFQRKLSVRFTHGSQIPWWNRGLALGSFGLFLGSTIVLLYKFNLSRRLLTTSGISFARLLYSHGSFLMLYKHGAFPTSQFVDAFAGLSPQLTVAGCGVPPTRPSSLKIICMRGDLNKCLGVSSSLVSSDLLFVGSFTLDPSTSSISGSTISWGLIQPPYLLPSSFPKISFMSPTRMA